MGDSNSMRTHLTQLEKRAGAIMTELKAMDADEVPGTTEHCRGAFDNEVWLSEELQQVGNRFDRLEDVQQAE